MRDRAPRICGVGVWSLLLSLCLASLTHAHRSHTGRCLYMFPPAGRVALASPFTRRGRAASNFYSRVVDLEWIGCAPPEGTQTSHSKGKQKTTGAGCQELMKSSLILERRAWVILWERSFQFRGIHVFSVTEVATLQNASRLQRWRRAPSCMD